MTKKPTAKATVEILIFAGPPTVEARIYLGDSKKPATTIDVLCQHGPWASATEAVISALERLAQEIEKDARKIGVHVRARRHGDPERKGTA